MRKLGSFQQMVLDYVIHNGEASISDLCGQFAPWKRRAGERNGHSENWRVIQVVESLKGKGLVVWVQPNRVKAADKAILLPVMTTATWSWYHGQLDYPESRRVKVHVLRPHSRLSHCGLENHDDEGEMSLQDFVDLGPDACSKCLRHVRAILK